MKKLLLSLAALALMAGCQRAVAPNEPAEDPQAHMEEDPMIRLDEPAANALAQSPLEVRGEARGPWFFEGSFPIELRDANGKTLAQGPAQAQGEWMTEEFVPFSGQLAFGLPETATGELWLIKENPSGLPENEDHRVVPVKFR